MSNRSCSFGPSQSTSACDERHISPAPSCGLLSPVRDTRSDFDLWYASTYPRVLAAIRAFANDDPIAREATDDAFVRALERWSRVRDLKSPVGWTVVVGMNRVKRFRARLVRERHAARRASSSPYQQTHETTIDSRIDVSHRLRVLTTRQRQVIVLHYFADLPVSTIASQLRIADGTVTATLAQARAKLRSDLEHLST